jgi:hypothetical protein
MEAEARDSGDQLREMAEKVFQLLERLKLAELAKAKAMEALRRKDQEQVCQSLLVFVAINVSLVNTSRDANSCCCQCNSFKYSCYYCLC